jgi:hypothetical protein
MGSVKRSYPLGNRPCYDRVIESDLVRNYPLHTVSKSVSGSEVQKLAHALKSGGYVAIEAALALAKRIATRRHYQTTAQASIKKD